MFRLQDERASKILIIYYRFPKELCNELFSLIKMKIIKREKKLRGEIWKVISLKGDDLNKKFSWQEYGLEDLRSVRERFLYHQSLRFTMVLGVSLMIFL